MSNIRLYGTFELKGDILEVIYPSFEPSVEEYKDYLKRLDTFILNDKKINIIYDTTNSKYLSADNRILQSNWIKLRQKELKENVKMMYFIIPSLPVRLVLKTILAFSPLPCPHEVVKDRSEIKL
ncbi:MAG: hypothetical protein SFY32_12290 [Bacteroidota bacterium]|nr:hypothetical protein [Bacteroidota bacterium]